jgi:hypothetical protein
MDDSTETSVPATTKPLPEVIAETLELMARYVREQADDVVQRSVVKPLQKLGGYLGLGIVAAFMAGTGLVFMAIGLFQGLAALVGSTWAAWLIVASVYLLVAVVMVAVRIKFRQ